MVVFSKTESLGAEGDNTETEYHQSEDTAKDDEDDGEGMKMLGASTIVTVRGNLGK